MIPCDKTTARHAGPAPTVQLQCKVHEEVVIEIVQSLTAWLLSLSLRLPLLL